MKRTDKRLLAAATVAVSSALVVVGFVLWRPNDDSESWEPAAEGFLAVATPCCSEAHLWDELGSTDQDGQRARPASAVEAAGWLNSWGGGSNSAAAQEPRVAAQNIEVRCVGKPTGEPIVPNGNDVETIHAIRRRPECMYSKWKIWISETAEGRPNERHTLWIDEDGFFHGRVDHWR